MTNFVIKNDLFFTLQKSEGNTDFPRKFYAKKVSGNQIKIRTLGSNEALLVDVWSLENFTINGVTYTDVHTAITALQAILWNEAYAGETTDLLPILTEIRDELLNDDSYQLFEDTDGNVLFGKIDNDGIMKYYKPDGTIYTGVVKPYSSGVITSSTDYCANSVPYTLIQFRDVDTKQVIASIWRNDNTLEESSTAPAGSTKGVCVVAGFAQDTFQAEDCEGNPIGDEQEIIKVVQLNKQISSVCNTSDIYDPIVAAIEDNAPQITNGKRHSLISYTAVAGDILTINPVFSTISMLVCKGEFHVENISNDFRSDLTKTDGTLVKYIALSADGLGTASGAKDLPQSLDTRANSKDLQPLLNSYSVTCIRDGVIQLELYKD
jgi:hypothetical protein